MWIITQRLICWWTVGSKVGSNRKLSSFNQAPQRFLSWILLITTNSWWFPMLSLYNAVIFHFEILLKAIEGTFPLLRDWRYLIFEVLASSSGDAALSLAKELKALRRGGSRSRQRHPTLNERWWIVMLSPRFYHDWMILCDSTMINELYHCYLLDSSMIALPDAGFVLLCSKKNAQYIGLHF